MNWVAVLLALLMVVSMPSGADENPEGATVAGGLISGVSTALSRVDIALAKSKLNLNHLKGDFAESLSEPYFMKRHLASSENWRPVTARFGRQGIDQVFLRYGSNGKPNGIIATEVKYGSSLLQNTHDGRQIGPRWTQKRLVALGNRYLDAANAKDVTVARASRFPAPRHVITIDLPNGRTGSFWRENAQQPWKYEGQKADLAKARELAASDGRYLRAGGQGSVTVGRKLIEVKPSGANIAITVKDAGDLDRGVPRNRIKGVTVHVPARMVRHHLTKEVSAQLQKKLPHLNKAEIDGLARTFSAKHGASVLSDTSDLSLKNAIYSNSLKAGLAGGLLLGLVEAGNQLSDGEFDPLSLGRSTALGLASGGVAVAAGQLTTANLISRQAFAQSAARIGVSTSALANSAGVVSGSSAASLLIAYGGWLAGAYDLDTANRAASIGLAGTAGGTIGYLATMGLVTAYGTAGTGAAISGLSGAAASNAALAWLGGGTLGAGGGGMAAGSLVLGGLVFASAAIVTAVGLYVVHLMDEAKSRDLLDMKLKLYTSDMKLFEQYAVSMYPLKM
jgi:hypothetical protein